MQGRPRPQAPIWSRILIIVVAALLFIPSVVMVVSSFFDKGEFTSKWYIAILTDSQMLAALGRSVIVGLFSSIAATLIGLTSALALYKTKASTKWLLDTFSIISLVLPELVFALSLLSWFFILNWELGLATIFVAHVTFSVAFSLFIISSRLAQLDVSLDQAAFDLGATPLQTLLKINLPLLLPAIWSSALICFLMSFDDFLISFFVNGAGSDTLPIKLYTSMKMGHSPKLSALASLMLFFSLALVALLLSIKPIRNALLGASSPQNEIIE
jgi:spermidine/putrescine transport system permease protein